MNTAETLAQVRALDGAAHLHPFSRLHAPPDDPPFVVERGEGVVVQDSEGRAYLDGAAGLWCVNVGHGRKEIAAAVAEQMGRLAFFQSFNGSTNGPTARLAARVLDLAGGGMRRVFFGNSGSDANDSAVKLVWLYNNLRGLPAKKKIVARLRGYHGVTVAAGSLTGLPGVHALFDLPLPGMLHVSAPDRYRSPERTAADYAAELDALIRREGPGTVAAFFAEPVMGTGGVLPPPPGYFAAIRAVCDRHDVLLVLDEVISGFGRLGMWFGAQRFDVRPDLVTLAKGLTSSYLPMSALLVGDTVWSVLDARRAEVGVFGHGFTTSGHPACAAAAMANLDIIEREGLVARAGEMGTLLLERVRAACGAHPLVGDVRGCGLMVGVELVARRDARLGFDKALGVAGRAQRAARDAGLLLRALPLHDVVALSPPFTITPAEIDQIAVRLLCALDAIAAALRAEGHWQDH